MCVCVCLVETWFQNGYTLLTLELFFFDSSSAPDYFDPTTIARHLGDNWALKSSNLRKLVRNLEWYYHEDLKKDADFDNVTASLGNIARSGDPKAIASLIELVAAAAVVCELKGMFVGRIMRMNQNSQIHMKGVIESGMKRLSTYEANNKDDDDLDMNFDTPEDTKDDVDDADVADETNQLKDPD